MPPRTRCNSKKDFIPSWLDQSKYPAEFENNLFPSDFEFDFDLHSGSEVSNQPVFPQVYIIIYCIWFGYEWLHYVTSLNDVNFMFPNEHMIYINKFSV